MLQSACNVRNDLPDKSKVCFQKAPKRQASELKEHGGEAAFATSSRYTTQLRPPSGPHVFANGKNGFGECSSFGHPVRN